MPEECSGTYRLLFSGLLEHMRHVGQTGRENRLLAAVAPRRTVSERAEFDYLSEGGKETDQFLHSDKLACSHTLPTPAQGGSPSAGDTCQQAASLNNRGRKGSHPPQESIKVPNQSPRKWTFWTCPSTSPTCARTTRAGTRRQDDVTRCNAQSEGNCGGSLKHNARSAGNGRKLHFEGNRVSTFCTYHYHRKGKEKKRERDAREGQQFDGAFRTRANSVHLANCTTSNASIVLHVRLEIQHFLSGLA
ncbi:hypothetical protein AOLI_G00218410 [Acnodon oligacanthus]